MMQSIGVAEDTLGEAGASDVSGKPHGSGVYPCIDARERGSLAPFVEACFDTFLKVAPCSRIRGSLQPRLGRVAHGFIREGETTRADPCEDHLERLIPGLDCVGTGTFVASEPSLSRAQTREVSPEVQNLWLVLHHRETVIGLFELERPKSAPAFSWTERGRLERLSDVVTSAAISQLDLLDAQCEVAVLRSIGCGHKTYLLFSREKKMVVWGSERGRPVNWLTDVETCERSIIHSAECLLEAQSSDELLPTPMPARFGMLVAASVVATNTPFGSDCAAMGFRPLQEGCGPIMTLSEQERMVARLLIRGFQPLNIAALTGISEHTVRTYIRRIYKKLQVSNRADLVRILLSDP
jgi:DNA-binding CsgD family transcriptional regulator